MKHASSGGKAAQQGGTAKNHVYTWVCRKIAGGLYPGRVERPDFMGETSPGDTLISPLSKREIEVLRLMANGSGNKEIASQLVISIGTVKRHVVHILQKLGAANRTQAVAIARKLEIV